MKNDKNSEQKSTPEVTEKVKPNTLGLLMNGNIEEDIEAGKQESVLDFTEITYYNISRLITFKERKLLYKLEDNTINLNQLRMELSNLELEDQGRLYELYIDDKEGNGLKTCDGKTSFDMFIEFHIDNEYYQKYNRQLGLDDETINQYRTSLYDAYHKLKYPPKSKGKENETSSQLREIVCDTTHSLLGIRTVVDTVKDKKRKESKKDDVLLYYVDLYHNSFKIVTTNNLTHRFKRLISDISCAPISEVGVNITLINDIMNYSKGGTISTISNLYQFKNGYYDFDNNRFIMNSDMNRIIYTPYQANVLLDKEAKKYGLIEFIEHYNLDWFKDQINHDYTISSDVGETILTIWNITVDKTKKVDSYFYRILYVGLMALSGRNPHKQIPYIFTENTNSGKTLLMNIFRRLIFKECSMSIVLNAKDQFYNKLIEGKHLLIQDETSRDNWSSENIEKYKRWSGNGGETTREMHSTEEVNIDYFPPFVIATNERPKNMYVDVNDGSVFDRYNIMEFPNRFLTKRRMESLTDDDNENVYLSDPYLFDRLEVDVLGITQLWSLLINIHMDGMNNFFNEYGEQPVSETEKFLETTNQQDLALLRLFRFGGELNDNMVTADYIIEKLTEYFEAIEGIAIPLELSDKQSLGYRVEKVFKLHELYGEKGRLKKAYRNEYNEIKNDTRYNLVYTGYIESNETKVYIDYNTKDNFPEVATEFNRLLSKECSDDDSKIVKYIVEDKQSPVSIRDLTIAFSNLPVMAIIRNLEDRGILEEVN